MTSPCASTRAPALSFEEQHRRDRAPARRRGDGQRLAQRGLFVHTTGLESTFVGFGAGNLTTTGTGNNAAFGFGALSANTTGLVNTGLGDRALASNTTGLRNVAVGFQAGYNQTTGNDNVYLANLGVAAETGQIKIGPSAPTPAATIAGISGATSAAGIAVLVNASGKLGTTTSSARFKQDVRDMGDASDVLMRLRPVIFRYREDAVGAEDAKTTQYGLIAEEVAEIAPELVAPDLEGRPYSVKYHELPALLLAQNQQQQRTIEAQAWLLSEQRDRIAALSTRMERLERR